MCHPLITAAQLLQKAACNQISAHLHIHAQSIRFLLVVSDSANQILEAGRKEVNEEHNTQRLIVGDYNNWGCFNLNVGFLYSRGN